MHPNVTWLRYAFLWTTVAFVSLSAYKVMIAIIMNGALLASRQNAPPEPERVQLIAGTMAAAAAYAASCMGTLGTPHPHLVEPASWMIALSGGSQLAYLIGKTLRLG